MAEIKTDPNTGLPELPEGYTWKVYRNSKIRILRNGFRTKYKANLPEVFCSKHIDDRAEYLATKFYHERDHHEEVKVEEERKEFKNFTIYLDKYKTNLPELKVGFRWRLIRRYSSNCYYYLEIVRETGFRNKVIASAELYETDVFPVLFDTYEESLQIDPDWAHYYSRPEIIFERPLDKEQSWGFNRVYNKYRMYLNEFNTRGTFGVEGNPNLYYTVEWLVADRRMNLQVRLHGRLWSYGTMPIYPDYAEEGDKFLKGLNQHIQTELKYLIKRREQMKQMKSLVGKYPPKTLRKDDDG